MKYKNGGYMVAALSTEKKARKSASRRYGAEKPAGYPSQAVALTQNAIRNR